MPHTKEQIRNYIKTSIEHIEPVDETEIQDKKSIKNFLVLHPDNFYDHQNFKGHIIASGLVFSERQIFLTRDKEAEKWIWPGGHCEEGEMPYETAERKIKEKIEVDNLVSKYFNEENEPVPFYCNIYSVPEEGEENEHRHLNLLYVYEVKNLKIRDEFKDMVKVLDQKEAEHLNPLIKKIFLKLAGRVII